MRVSVRLDTLKDAVLAPSAAVQTGIKGPYVYVVTANNTADLRQLETGLSEEGLTVVKSGLAAGDKVVVDGYLLLTPGAPVALKTGKAAADDAPAGKDAKPAQPAEGAKP